MSSTGLGGAGGVRETDNITSPRSADRAGAVVIAPEGRDPADLRIDGHGVSARTVLALDALLLDSKLSFPQPRPGSVSRAGLIEAARASECRVIGVTAPAGYGKPTLPEAPRCSMGLGTTSAQVGCRGLHDRDHLA